jgi:hypothetical protein
MRQINRAWPVYLCGAGALALLIGLARLTGLVAASEGRAAPDPTAAEMVQAAREVYEGSLKQAAVEPERIPLDQLYQWSRRWLEAQRAASDNKARRIEAYQSHLERMQALEVRMNKLLEAKLLAPFERSAATYYRAEAEQLLREAKGR